MADKAELERLVREGARARTLMQDPEFKSAIESVRNDLATEFFAADPSNDDQLRLLVLQRQCLDSVLVRVLSKIDTANGAEAALRQK